MDKEDSKTNLLSVIFWTVGILLIALFVYFYIILPFPEWTNEGNLISWTKIDINKISHDYGVQKKAFLDANITEQSIFNKVYIYSKETGRGIEKLITVDFKSDTKSKLRVIGISCSYYTTRFDGIIKLLVNKNYDNNINEQFLLNGGRAIIIVEDSTSIYKFYIDNMGDC